MKRFRDNNNIEKDQTWIFFLAALCCIFAIYLCDGAHAAMRNEAEKVQSGDLVSVYYSLSLENGGLVMTNDPECSADPARIKAEEYEEYSVSGPSEILAGQRDLFPGVHDAVLGMKEGESKRYVIPPEEAYGQRSEEKVKAYSSIRVVPKKIQMTVEKFKEQYGAKPQKEDRVRLNPYFYYRVADVNDTDILFEAEINDALISDDLFGRTRIVPDGEKIIITLEPKLGASFEADNQKGKISAIDKESFKVDFNSPLAGKTLSLEVKVVSIKKASISKDWDISWLDDHDKGLDAAKGLKKPVVLILYADWCPWCKQLLTETLKDPRVTMFRNDFVWIKANSDQDKSLKALYGQDNFPFIIFMDADGKIVKNLSGFKYAYEMRDELKQALQR